MKPLQGAAVAVVLAATAIAAAPPAPRDEPALAVGMLRRDGVLLPFAAYRAGRWTSSWPRPAFRFEAPLTFEAIPKGWWGPVTPATTWIAWPTGGEPHAVHVRGPVVVPAHCLSVVGLATDYVSPEPLPPLTQQHHPKDGVATMGNDTVDPIEVMDENSPEAARTLENLMPEIEKAERKVLTGEVQRALRLPNPGGAAAPKLEVLCRSKSAPDGTTAHYFELARDFPQGSGAKPGCNRQLFTQGFVVLDAEGPARSVVFATPTDCNRNDIDFGLPLGSLSLDGKQYWIVQFSGRGREQYAIVETDARKVEFILNVLGGGC